MPTAPGDSAGCQRRPSARVIGRSVYIFMRAVIPIVIEESIDGLVDIVGFGHPPFSRVDESG